MTLLPLRPSRASSTMFGKRPFTSTAFLSEYIESLKELKKKKEQSMELAALVQTCVSSKIAIQENQNRIHIFIFLSKRRLNINTQLKLQSTLNLYIYIYIYIYI